MAGDHSSNAMEKQWPNAPTPRSTLAFGWWLSSTLLDQPPLDLLVSGTPPLTIMIRPCASQWSEKQERERKKEIREERETEGVMRERGRSSLELDRALIGVSTCSTKGDIGGEGKRGERGSGFRVGHMANPH